MRAITPLRLSSVTRERATRKDSTISHQNYTLNMRRAVFINVLVIFYSHPIFHDFSVFLHYTLFDLILWGYVNRIFVCITAFSQNDIL
jgi:hypothetical protein